MDVTNPQKVRRKRRLHDLVLGGCMKAAALITCTLVFGLVLFILIQGLPSLSWELISTAPSYLTGHIGILPDLLNTVYLIFTALLIVLPLGIGAAVYLSEYAVNAGWIALIEQTTETLAGIPSILFGLVGMLFFCQFLGMRTSLMAGAMTLVIMNLPAIIRTTQESLKTVPQSLREGALALGSGKWHMIRTVVLPQCIDGIVSGTILATGRMLGESAALLFTAGFGHALYGFWNGLHSSGATLTVALYVYAKEQGEFGIAFAIAALLLVLVFLMNGLAALVRHLMKRRKMI